MKKEDIAEYFRKSGDESLDLRGTLVDNEHGFATYSLTPDAVIVHTMYGNGRYWENFFVNLAKREGLSKIRFATRRNSKAWQKRYKSRVVGYILEREV